MLVCSLLSRWRFVIQAGLEVSALVVTGCVGNVRQNLLVLISVVRKVTGHLWQLGSVKFLRNSIFTYFCINFFMVQDQHLASSSNSLLSTSIFSATLLINNAPRWECECRAIHNWFSSDSDINRPSRLLSRVTFILFLLTTQALSPSHKACFQYRFRTGYQPWTQIVQPAVAHHMQRSWLQSKTHLVYLHLLHSRICISTVTMFLLTCHMTVT